MGFATDRRQADTDGELEFFGFQLRVKSPHLAALLTGDDDGVAIVRARDDAPDESPPVASDSTEAWTSGQGDTGGAVVQIRRPLPGC